MKLQITTSWAQATFRQGREIIRLATSDLSESERLPFAISAAVNFAITPADVLALPTQVGVDIAERAAAFYGEPAPAAKPVSAFSGYPLPAKTSAIPFGVYVYCAGVMDGEKHGVEALDAYASICAAWLCWSESGDISPDSIDAARIRVENMPYSDVLNFGCFFLRKLRHLRRRGANRRLSRMLMRWLLGLPASISTALRASVLRLFGSTRNIH